MFEAILEGTEDQSSLDRGELSEIVSDRSKIDSLLKECQSAMTQEIDDHGGWQKFLNSFTTLPDLFSEQRFLSLSVEDQREVVVAFFSRVSQEMISVSDSPLTLAEIEQIQAKIKILINFINRIQFSPQESRAQDEGIGWSIISTVSSFLTSDEDEDAFLKNSFLIAQAVIPGIRSRGIFAEEKDDHRYFLELRRIKLISSISDIIADQHLAEKQKNDLQKILSWLERLQFQDKTLVQIASESFTRLQKMTWLQNKRQANNFGSFISKFTLSKVLGLFRGITTENNAAKVTEKSWQDRVGQNKMDAKGHLTFNKELSDEILSQSESASFAISQSVPQTITKLEQQICDKAIGQLEGRGEQMSDQDKKNLSLDVRTAQRILCIANSLVQTHHRGPHDRKHPFTELFLDAEKNFKQQEQFLVVPVFQRTNGGMDYFKITVPVALDQDVPQVTTSFEAILSQIRMCRSDSHNRAQIPPEELERLRDLSLMPDQDKQLSDKGLEEIVKDAHFAVTIDEIENTSRAKPLDLTQLLTFGRNLRGHYYFNDNVRDDQVVKTESTIKFAHPYWNGDAAKKHADLAMLVQQTVILDHLTEIEEFFPEGKWNVKVGNILKPSESLRNISVQSEAEFQSLAREIYGQFELSEQEARDFYQMWLDLRAEFKNVGQQFTPQDFLFRAIQLMRSMTVHNLIQSRDDDKLIVPASGVMSVEMINAYEQLWKEGAEITDDKIAQLKATALLSAHLDLEEKYLAFKNQTISSVLGQISKQLEKPLNKMANNLLRAKSVSNRVAEQISSFFSAFVSGKVKTYDARMQLLIESFEDINNPSKTLADLNINLVDLINMVTKAESQENHVVLAQIWFQTGVEKEHLSQNIDFLEFYRKYSQYREDPTITNSQIMDKMKADFPSVSAETVAELASSVESFFEISHRVSLVKKYLSDKFSFTQSQLDLLFEGPSDFSVITAQAAQYGYRSRDKLLKKGGVEKIEGGDGMYYRQHGLFALVMSRKTVKIEGNEYEVPSLSERLLPHQFDVDRLVNSFESVIAAVVKKYGLNPELTIQDVGGLKSSVVEYLLALGDLDNPETYRQRCVVQLDQIGEKLRSIFSEDDKRIILNFDAVINGHDLLQLAMRRYARLELKEMMTAMRFYHHCMTKKSDTDQTISPDQSTLELAFNRQGGIFSSLTYKNRSPLLFV